jgi:hypothetical protein
MKLITLRADRLSAPLLSFFFLPFLSLGYRLAFHNTSSPVQLIAGHRVFGAQDTQAPTTPPHSRPQSAIGCHSFDLTFTVRGVEVLFFFTFLPFFFFVRPFFSRAPLRLVIDSLTHTEHLFFMVSIFVASPN